jgi:hypothetical protein
VAIQSKQSEFTKTPNFARRLKHADEFFNMVDEEASGLLAGKY